MKELKRQKLEMYISCQYSKHAKLCFDLFLATPGEPLTVLESQQRKTFISASAAPDIGTGRMGTGAHINTQRTHIRRERHREREREWTTLSEMMAYFIAANKRIL